MDVQSDFSETALCIQLGNQRGLIGHIQLHSWPPVCPAGKWVSAIFFFSVCLFHLFPISLVTESILPSVTESQNNEQMDHHKDKNALAQAGFTFMLSCSHFKRIATLQDHIAAAFRGCV